MKMNTRQMLQRWLARAPIAFFAAELSVAQALKLGTNGINFKNGGSQAEWVFKFSPQTTAQKIPKSKRVPDSNNLLRVALTYQLALKNSVCMRLKASRRSLRSTSI
jgi:hypothetical protein